MLGEKREFRKPPATLEGVSLRSRGSQSEIPA